MALRCNLRGHGASSVTPDDGVRLWIKCDQRVGAWNWLLAQLVGLQCTNLVDPASSHMLVSKIKPCMSQYKLLYGETANGSLKQL